MYLLKDMYIIQSVCVCVCVRACVRATVRACVCVKYMRPNGWTDHDQIWHAYMGIDREWFLPKKKFPMYGPDGWAHWGNSLKRVLSGRAASTQSRGSESLAKQF